MKDLKSYGGWALITGAAAGIGRELARAIATGGVDCVLVDKNGEGIRDLAVELARNHGVQCRAIHQDLTSNGWLDRIVKETRDIPIGILVNDAGVGCPGPTHTRDPEYVEHVIKVNAIAPALLTRTFLPQMVERDSGAVIMLASIVALLPTPFETLYCATKAFNLIYGEALWGEMRGTNIDILNVCPTATRTDFWASEGLFKDVQEKMANKSDSPEHIARIALANLGKGPTVGPWSMRVPVFLSRFVPRWIPAHFAGKFARRVMKTDQL